MEYPPTTMTPVPSGMPRWLDLTMTFGIVAGFGLSVLAVLAVAVAVITTMAYVIVGILVATGMPIPAVWACMITLLVAAIAWVTLP